MAERKSYRFGPFLVDRRSACLRRDGVVVPLRPKTFDVLTYLAQHPGRLVPKTELIDNVWQNLNVTPNSLAQCIREIRHALHDDTQAIIETVSKRGYLFALPVIAVDGNDAPLSAEAGESRALPLPDRPSIAVLPFDNMSGDPDQDYFADGISEDLITGLSRIRWLFVIARNSTFVYKGRAVDVRQVARELGVRYVLEGSVRRAGKRLRISAQLIDAMTGGHHWAEQYDRELGDIFAMQDEITRSVVGAIEPRLLAAEGVRAFSRSPGDLGAWELVARAQTHVWRLNRADYEAAIDALIAPSMPIRTTLRPGACWVSAWCFQRILAGSIAIRACMPAVSTSSGDRARRLRSVGADSARLLVDDGMAHRGVDRGVPARRQPQSEFSGGALLSQSRARVCRAVLRCHRAWQRSDPAKPVGPGYRDVPRRHCRRALSRRPIRGSLRDLGTVAAAAPGLSRRPTPALREPGPDGQSGGGQKSLAAVRLEQPQLSVDWIKSSVPYQTPELMEHFLAGMRKAGLT